jgi:hypothetical protein
MRVGYVFDIGEAVLKKLTSEKSNIYLFNNKTFITFAS